MQIFQYAILYTPTQTKDQLERGEEPKTTMLVPLTPILAKDPNQANMIAARAIPESHIDKLDDLVLVVRPF